MSDFYLIVGLGNPGREYKNTRHNIGFQLLDEMAKKLSVSFKKEKRFKGEIAHAEIKKKEVIFLKPGTYMNASGEAVGAAFDYYKIDINKLLVAVDDADIGFGQMRLKENSGAGGHKGLESIQQQLQTASYARLKIGIGKGAFELAEHVLDKFTSEEEKQLPEILNKANEAIAIWLEHGIAKAANYANTRKKTNNKNQEGQE